jgi:hypothetical protein
MTANVRSECRLPYECMEVIRRPEFLSGARHPARGLKRQLRNGWI